LYQINNIFLLLQLVAFNSIKRGQVDKSNKDLQFFTFPQPNTATVT